MGIFSAGSASVSIVPDFSGAQKAIGEWFARQSDVRVAVHPDLSNVDVLRTEAELNAMHGTAKVEVDHDLLGRSIATGIEAAIGLSGLDKLGALLTATIKPTVITAIGGALTAMGAAASQAVGAVALLPAVLAAIATPAAAVAIGIHGVGAAFKALDTGNAQKIADTMSKLAPAAQDFVTQVHALGPAWSALRLDVQQQLFAGIGTAVTNLANVALPILRTGLSQTASALNGGLVATLTALTGQGPAFTTMFTNIAASIRVANGAAAPLVSAFATLGAVGSQFLPVLAQGFVNVATAFNTWIQHLADSGQLVVIIQNAIDVLKQLGTIALNVGKIVGGIFEAAVGPGRVLLDLLIQVTGQLATFIHSADGQSALRSFFDSVQTAFATLMPALGTLVQVIIGSVLPAIGQFAALLAPIGAMLITQFAGGLQAVAAIVPPVVQVMAALISATAPLVTVFFQLIQILLPPLVSFFSQLAPVVSALSTAIGQALLGAANAIAPILPVVGNALIGILEAVKPLLPLIANLVVSLLPPLGAAFVAIVQAVAPLVPYLVQIVQSLLPPLVGIVAALIPSIGSFVGALGPVLKIFLAIVDATVLPLAVALLNGLKVVLDFLSPVLGPLAAIIVSIVAAVKLWSLAMGILDIALDANPIGIIVVAIGALIAAVGLIATHTKEIAQIWHDVWQAVSDFFVAIWTSITTWFTGVLNSFVTTWTNIWTSVKDFFVTIWNAIFSFFQGLWNGLVAWVEGVWTALAGWFAAAWTAYSTAWSNFWNAIFSFFQNLWNTLVGWIENLWNTLAGWFAAAWGSYTTAWTNFWNAVFSFFQNLWNTLVGWIESVWSGLAAWFANAWNAFTQAWDNFWNTIFSFFQNLWNAMVGWVQNLWNGLYGWFSGALNSFLGLWTNIWNGVSSTFVSVWNGIKSFAQAVWNDIKAIIAAPVNFVIGTILNGGLFRAWNAVNDFLHLPWHIQPLPLVQFASGGYTGDYGLFGTGAREDPAGIVHAREFVFTANQVDAAGGPGAMYAMASQLDSGYSMGGEVRNQASDPGLHLGSYVVPPSIAPRIKRFLDALSVGQAEAVQAAGGFDALGPNFYWGGYADPISAGKAFASAQNGKPYVWGGVGPNGYDCSGFQSAITNVLRGSSSPYSRLGTTDTFPWSGFTSGLTGSYGIGAFRSSRSGAGHMAGTLAGINAESGGSHNNVAFGGPAVGADSSQFNIHGTLAQVGGQFASGGGGGGPSVISILGHIITGAGDILKMLTDSITGPINTLLGMGQGGSWLSILAGVPRQLLSGLWGIVKDKVAQFLAPMLSDQSNNPTTNGGLLDQAMGVAQAMYGWGSSGDRSAADYIVSHESGWNPRAQNPTSSASGLWQLIDSTWMANRPVGDAYSHAKDAPTGDQDHAGLKYIHDRYGSLPNAQSFWAGHHYYDVGGWLPPGWSSVYNGTGGFEAVLNRAQQDSIVNALSKGGGSGAPPVWHFYLGTKEVTDLIDARVEYRNDKDSRTVRSGA